jgi:hypothetical protein
VVGYAAIVDRRPADLPNLAGGPAGVGELTSLLRVDAPAWERGACPRCVAGDPIDAPGSRNLAR